MVAAIRQTVTVGSGGKVEIQSPELREGATAEVIVLLDEAPATTPAERVALWRRLQKSMKLSAEQAAAWAEEVRQERRAFGP